MEEYQNGGTARVLSLPKELKIKIIEGENMVKKYIKNITGDKNSTKYFEPQTLAYKEDGKRIELNGQELKETKLTKSLSHRLVLITEDEVKGKKKEKKEVK